MKRAIAFLLCLMAMLAMCSCGKKEEKKPTAEVVKPDYVAVSENGSRTDDAIGFQLMAPEIGETVAVFETTMGTIIMRLFPESAPITVANFKGLIENKYYDGITFHRVINGFMIQGGDPTATGMEGKSVWGSDFEDEFNANLLNLRGAVAMANSGVNTNGSQFFINQNKTSYTEEDLDYDIIYQAYYTQNKDDLTQWYTSTPKLQEQYADSESYIKAVIDAEISKTSLLSYKVPEEAWKLYEKVGGNITLDGAWKLSGGHSVFAQVVVGMSVVDAISAVEKGRNDKPIKDVVINKAYLTAFTEQMKANMDGTTLDDVWDIGLEGSSEETPAESTQGDEK